MPLQDDYGNYEPGLDSEGEDFGQGSSTVAGGTSSDPNGDGITTAIYNQFDSNGLLVRQWTRNQNGVLV